MTATRFVCSKCNVFVESQLNENGKTPKPKCANNYDATEVESFWKMFVVGMLGVCLLVGAMNMLAWVSTVIARLFWAFFGLWPLAAVIAFCQGIGYAFRSGPVRELAPQTMGRPWEWFLICSDGRLFPVDDWMVALSFWAFVKRAED